MKKALRCFISCILPCGALDVIRIVHCNGKVEEISGKVTASEIMKAYPKHVLKKPSSSNDGIVSKIVIVPPDAELQRGKIYFLMPVPSSSTKQEKGRSNERSSSRMSAKKKRVQHVESCNKSNDDSKTDLVVSDKYVSKILSEKVSNRREKRRGRVGAWRPHLESICESVSVCSGES